jgi:UDP-glucose 4-epimerase
MVLRDYVYASDIANAFLSAALHEGEPKIYNIGGGQGHSLNDIISILENITRRPLQPKYLPGRLFDVPVNVLDITRAKKYLNWQPTVGLSEGILHSYEWMLKEYKK